MKKLEELTKELSEIGTVQIIKEGYVFSLLMTGKDFTKWNVSGPIQALVVEYTKEKYPFIEAMRNEDNFLCMILRP